MGCLHNGTDPFRRPSGHAVAWLLQVGFCRERHISKEEREERKAKNTYGKLVAEKIVQLRMPEGGEHSRDHWPDSGVRHAASPRSHLFWIFTGHSGILSYAGPTC